MAALGPTTPLAADAPPLNAAVLGRPDAEAAGRLTDHGDGSFTLTAAGREAYMGRDEGTFAYLDTEAPNFTFSARIKAAPQGTPNPKYGLSLRTDLTGEDRCVALRYDGYEKNRCLQWFLRHHRAPDPHEGSGRCFIDGLERGMNATQDFHLRITRRYPHVRLAYSADGETWQSIDYDHSLIDQAVKVGVQLTAGGDGKKPVSMTFDQVRFTVDGAADEALDNAAGRAMFEEDTRPTRPYDVHFTAVDIGSEEGPFTAFVMIPQGLDPAALRAVMISSGSKELNRHGERYGWTNGKGMVRIPADLDGAEGSVVMDGLEPFYDMLAYHGVVRVGGAFHPKHYPQAIERLAEATGIEHLPDLPVMLSGASFAGGYSYAGAAAMPQKTIAAAPVIIGMAGANTQDRAVLDTPLVHIYGSRDGPHLKDALDATPKLREKNARWANAPMWHVYHRQHKADALIYPYFFEAMRLRLPEDWRPTDGPPKLRTLEEADGWWGLIDTWETNHPRVVKVSEYDGDTSRAVWLPGELSARVWAAFVSNNPRTVIHFPTFDGRNEYMGPLPRGWHNSTMLADQPFRLLASGPTGDDVTVAYYDGERELNVIETHGSPYHVTLEALPAGLHTIYAITTIGEAQEISRPVSIWFAPPQR